MTVPPAKTALLRGGVLGLGGAFADLGFGDLHLGVPGVGGNVEELRGFGGITAVKGAHEGAGDVFRRFGASAAREGERGGAGDEQGGRLDEAAAVDHDGFLLYLSFGPARRLTSLRTCGGFSEVYLKATRNAGRRDFRTVFKRKRDADGALRQSKGRC